MRFHFVRIQLLSRGSAGTNAAKIQIIIDTPKILRRKKYTGSFFIQLNPHNPLNFSVLSHFLSDFLASSNLSSYLCRASYSFKQGAI